MSAYDEVDVFVELVYYLDVLPNVDVVCGYISCILYLLSPLYYIVTKTTASASQFESYPGH
jgi:hypothetical protein